MTRLIRSWWPRSCRVGGGQQRGCSQRGHRRFLTSLSSNNSDASSPVLLHSMEYPSLHSSSSSPVPPPLLIAHGLLGNSTNWAGIAKRPQLCSRHRCIAVDLRNHGQSPHSPEMSYEAMAGDLLSLMDRKGIERVIGMGHSLGGKVMMAAALLYPDRFSALIVVDIAPFDYNTMGRSWSGVSHIVQSLSRVEWSVVRSRSDVDRQLKPFIVDPSTRGFVLQNVVPVNDERSAFRWRLNLPVLTDNLNYFSTFPFNTNQPHDTTNTTTTTSTSTTPPPHSRSVSPSSLPTLFVKGGDSDFITDVHLPSLRRFFPSHRLVTIDQSAHWVHADQPHKFVEAVEQFLNEHDMG
jgi:pimeloyl-ACP methyl ester carboxylesterase